MSRTRLNRRIDSSQELYRKLTEDSEISDDLLSMAFMSDDIDTRLAALWRDDVPCSRLTKEMMERILRDVPVVVSRLICKKDFLPTEEQADELLRHNPFIRISLLSRPDFIPTEAQVNRAMERRHNMFEDEQEAWRRAIARIASKENSAPAKAKLARSL